jgi:phosphoserine phosphatase
MDAARLAAFDMDGTLIDGRLVFALAERFDLALKVREIQSSGKPGSHQTKDIAELFAGLTEKDMESAIRSIPLTKNCERVIALLRKKNYRIGIISDSYTIAAGFVADRLGLDFVAANELEIVDGKLTGRVEMPLGWEKIGCFCKISVCKRYHLEKYARRFGVPIEYTIAVGDTKSDICMIQRASTGVAFMPKDEQIANATDKVVKEPDLLRVLDFVS